VPQAIIVQFFDFVTNIQFQKKKFKRKIQSTFAFKFLEVFIIKKTFGSKILKYCMLKKYLVMGF
jgi:hypothetical protein